MHSSKDCNGCKTNESVVCLFQHYGQIEKCPCLLCLVKPICVDLCDNREEKVSKVINDQKEIYSDNDFPIVKTLDRMQRNGEG